MDAELRNDRDLAARADYPTKGPLRSAEMHVVEGFERLESLVSDLVAKLDPVLLPTEPSPMSGELAESRQPGSDLAGTLDRWSARLGQLGDTIAITHSRVDL